MRYITNGQMELALKSAAAACELDTNIFHPQKKSQLRPYERQTIMNYYDGIPLKRTYMHTKHLEMTFFFDIEGNARYVYTGYVDKSNAEADKVIESFDTAEKMRVFMERYLEQILEKSKRKAGVTTS